MLAGASIIVFSRTYKGLLGFMKEKGSLSGLDAWCLWKNQSDPNIKELFQLYEQEMDKWKNGKTERKRWYVSTYGQDEWDSILIDPDPQSKPEFDLSNLVQSWKKKVFKEKAWGLRKMLKKDDLPIQLRYDLLNKQLKEKDFNQVL